MREGLYKKYYISKTNGEDNSNEEYFVLRLDSNCTDKVHLEACKKALRTYAEEIKEHIPELSEDLFKIYLNN